MVGNRHDDWLILWLKTDLAYITDGNWPDNWLTSIVVGNWPDNWLISWSDDAEPTTLPRTPNTLLETRWGTLAPYPYEWQCASLAAKRKDQNSRLATFVGDFVWQRGFCTIWVDFLYELYWPHKVRQLWSDRLHQENQLIVRFQSNKQKWGVK